MASSENLDHLNNSPEIHQLSFKGKEILFFSPAVYNLYFLSIAEKPPLLAPINPGGSLQPSQGPLELQMSAF